MQFICVYLPEIPEHALGCSEEGYLTLHNRNALLSSFVSGKLRHRVQLASFQWHRRVENLQNLRTSISACITVCVNELHSLAGPSSISGDVSSINIPFSRRHRANGLRNRKLLLHQHLAHIWCCERWKRETVPGATQPWVCFWSTLLVASTLCRHLPYSEFSFDKIYEIMFRLSLHDIAKASFPILHLDCQFTQSTAGNHYFFKQSGPSLSVCEQKHAAIFLELSKGVSSSSFFSDRKVKVRIGVISFCLDVLKFTIIIFPQQNPRVNCEYIVQTHMCNFSTWDMGGFFHSSLSCPLVSSKKHTHKEDLTAQFDSQGFALSSSLIAIYGSSCRQRGIYGITVASHPFLPVLRGEGWCRF